MEASTNTYRTQNPSTDELIDSWESLDPSEVSGVINAADEAFASWRHRSVGERADILARTARLFEERADTLAVIAATEMGKPVAQGVAEAQLVAQIFDYYAQHADELMAGDILPKQGANSSHVEKEPLGVLLGVMPWNFPYYQLARFIAPNLLLGNTLLLKPASICAASALEMAKILDEAGLPKGVYQTILVDSSHIESIIADPRVRGVSLTGSEGAGASVASAAGKHLKKAVLELGGSDPLIVLGGDIDAVANSAAQARLSNAGQACNSPKRMIVLDEFYDAFVDGLSAAFSAAVVGDPPRRGHHRGPDVKHTSP